MVFGLLQAGSGRDVLSVSSQQRRPEHVRRGDWPCPGAGDDAWFGGDCDAGSDAEAAGLIGRMDTAFFSKAVRFGAVEET